MTESVSSLPLFTEAGLIAPGSHFQHSNHMVGLAGVNSAAAPHPQPEAFLGILCCVNDISHLKKISLAGVAQLVGYHSTKRKVAGSVSSQGTPLGCRFNLQLGCM